MSGDGGGEPFDVARAQYVACPVCGHDTSTTPEVDLPAAITQAAREWADWLRTVLDHPGGREDLYLAQPERWSALQYACHVRDGLAVRTQWILRIIMEDLPEIAAWDQDAAAHRDNYAEQDPPFVADDIVVNAGELAEILQVVTGDGWLRRGRVGPNEITLVGLGRLALHELLHHLGDARSGVTPETTGR